MTTNPEHGSRPQDAAKDEGARVAGHAKEAAQDVARHDPPPAPRGRAAHPRVALAGGGGARPPRRQRQFRDDGQVDLTLVRLASGTAGSCG